MKLLTKEIEKKLEKSPLYSTDGKQVKNVIVKFFCPFSAFTFLVFEGEKQGDDYLFYGAATMGYGYELGYYTLSELQKVKKFGVPAIERDRYFKGYYNTQLRDLV